jgi:MscS family membrane protein
MDGMGCIKTKFARRAVTIVLAAMLSAFSVWPQSLGNLFNNSNAAAATSSSSDNRATPRSSIKNFLAACYQERFVAATRYLDLSAIPPKDRTEEGPELAKDLANLLDRDESFEVENLSDQPEGNTSDGLDPGRDVLLRLNINGVANTLTLQRVTQNQARVWLVSADSVARIAELSTLAGESAFEKKLPPVLVRTKLIGTSIWIWIVLVVMALILSLLSGLFSRTFIALAKRYVSHLESGLNAAKLEAFVEPVRLLVSVVVFRALMETVNPSALLRDYLLRLLTLLFGLGAAALAMRIADALADQILLRLEAKDRAISYSVLPLGVRVVKICIFCAAILFVLANWGYNTNAILAGVGVGGLAIALAAQKTLENLFGGISLISDRPVLVGETCVFGGQQGTIEDIGLRSTRVRTLDRTLVTIPNSSFSTMTLENLSRRDRMWFHPTLRLRRDTPPERLREFMDTLKSILEEHPMVDASGVPLRFARISDQALELEIFAYVRTPDYNEYLKVHTELLLRFLEASIELGVGFAVPLTESLNVTVPDDQKAHLGFHLDGAPTTKHPLLESGGEDRLSNRSSSSRFG